MRPLGLLALLMLLGGFAWAVTDHLEQRNDFCTSCHLPDATPLHQEIREDFDRVIPVSLAGVHGRGWVEEREDSAFRCIDCHAGAAPMEHARVKAFAAWDGVRYLAGAFEEPDAMPFDLSKDACRRCHPTQRGSAAPGFTLEAFHGVAEHDAEDVPVCVSCHAVHERGGSGIVYFLVRERIDRECRGCHAEHGAAGAPVAPSGP